MAFPPKVWSGAVRRLSEDLPDFVLDTWVAPLVAVPEQDRLRLACPNAFHRERVMRRFRAQIADAVAAEAGRPVQLVFDVQGTPRAGAPNRATSEAPRSLRRARPSSHGQTASRERAEHERAPAADARRPSAQPASEPREDSPRAPQRGGATRSSGERSPRQGRDFKRFRFANFVAGSSNRLAREAAFALAHGEHEHHLRQLFITASPGQGKTHLARAVVGEAVARAEGRVVYTTAEGFLNAFTSSVRGRRMDRFKAQHRSCSLLVVEDVHFLIGKHATQLELFHTLEAVLDSGGRALLTGIAAPSQLDGLDRSLRSQLTRSFVAELGAPDAPLRRSILRDKAAGGGVRLPESCLELIAQAPTDNVRALESLLEQLVTTAALEARAIDDVLTREVLERKGATPTPTLCGYEPRDVVRAVAGVCGTTAELLASRSRRRENLEPRQIAMLLCRRLTDAPIAEIGRALGRHHSSVRNAIDKLEREMLRDAPLRYRVEAIRERTELRLRDASRPQGTRN